jgi:regulator of replication initiation timing
MQSKINEILTTIKSRTDLSLLEIKLSNVFDKNKIEEQTDTMNKAIETLSIVDDVSEEYILKEVANKLNIDLLELIKIPHENIEGLKQEIRVKKENENIDELVKVFQEGFKPCLKDANTQVDWLDMLCKFIIISSN